MTMERGQAGSVMVGAPVIAQDGDQLGTVKEVRGTFFKVDAPMQPDFWLRTDCVAQSSSGEVRLGFSKDRLGDYQFSSPDEVDAGAGRMTDYRATDHTHTEATGYADTRAERPYTERERATEGEQSVRLHEEQLQAQKRPVQAGEVGIRKEVVSEQQTIDVPVTREEVVIERRPVNREVTDEEIGEGRDEVRVPVREEQVDVQKRTVATEEINVGKRAVQETERVSDTVRREEARVETDGDVDVRGAGETRRPGENRRP